MEKDSEVQGKEVTFQQMVELTKEHNVVVDGPLSSACAAALNQVYSKQAPEDEESEETKPAVASESQQILKTQAQLQALSLLAAVQNLSSVGASTSVVYGVKESEVSASDIIAVTNIIDDPLVDKLNASAIIDRAEVASSAGKDYSHNPFAVSLEALCRANKVKVYTSVGAYVSSLKK
jgi:hypothetical protein